MKKKKVGGNDENLNYSIGVLIILLMVFWFTCKCAGGGVTPKPCKHETMRDNNLYYGNTPIKLGGKWNDIRLYDGRVVIPNSKSAMGRLYDNETNTCMPRRKDPDDIQISMHLSKQNEYFSIPRSKTVSHELMCNTSHKK